MEDLNLMARIKKVRVTNSGFQFKVPTRVPNNFSVSDAKEEELQDFVKSWIIIEYCGKTTKIWSSYKQKTIKRNILSLVTDSRNLNDVRESDVRRILNGIVQNIENRLDIEIKNADYSEIRNKASRCLSNRCKEAADEVKKFTLEKIKSILIVNGKDITFEDLKEAFDECQVIKMMKS